MPSKKSTLQGAFLGLLFLLPYIAKSFVLYLRPVMLFSLIKDNADKNISRKMNKMRWKFKIKPSIYRALLLSTSVLMSSALMAQPVQEKTLDHLIELSNFTGMIAHSNQNMRPMLEAQAEDILKNNLGVLELSSEQKHVAQKISLLLQKTNEAIISNPKFLHMIRKNFQQTYTEEEAQAYIQFLSTPMGQSINRKSSIMTINILQETLAISNEILNQPLQMQKFNEQLASIIQPLLLKSKS